MERNGTLERMEFLEQVERDGTSQTKMEPTEQMERVERMEFLEQVERARTNHSMPDVAIFFEHFSRNPLSKIRRGCEKKVGPFESITHLASDE
jgi:hypothetical protein